MSPDTKKPSFPTLLTHMVKTEGVSSIYAGLSAAIMRQAIYGTARIGLHRTFSDKLQEVGGNRYQENQRLELFAVMLVATVAFPSMLWRMLLLLVVSLLCFFVFVAAVFVL